MFLFGKNDTQEIETLIRDKQKLQKENNDLVQLKEKLDGEKKKFSKRERKIRKSKK
jgi:hypothetical protein